MLLVDPNRYFGDVVPGAVLGAVLDDGETLAPASFTRSVEIAVANVNETPQ